MTKTTGEKGAGERREGQTKAIWPSRRGCDAVFSPCGFMFLILFVKPSWFLVVSSTHPHPPWGKLLSTGGQWTPELDPDGEPGETQL